MCFLLQIIKFVPQQEAWIVERMGKFDRMLEPGLNILIPLIDRVKYVKSLKETAIEVPSQSAITQGKYREKRELS
jgi:regulator of protease activity HflC (stomatin/prohibitin superfamily)